jgi:hypothetical protein
MSLLYTLFSPGQCLKLTRKNIVDIHYY